jgi:diacylglycerol kinase (ATP)
LQTQALVSSPAESAYNVTTAGIESDRRAAGSNAGRTFVIINPQAGSDRPERLARRVGAAFDERDAPFDLVMTEYAGHATLLAREASALGYRAVAVVGGDGTLAEAANGIAGTNTPLALIPRGTANQVAQNLRIPVRLESAVDVAINGRLMSIDLGEVNGRTFTLVAGAGFDAAVMAAATRSLKERYGFGAYIYAAMTQALNYAPAEFHIVADGRVIDVSAVSVMLANAGELFTAYLPLRFALCPSPKLSWQDGLLEVVVVAPRGVSGFASLLWRAARRQFAEVPPLLHFQAREITIESTPIMPVQIDGDLAGETPLIAKAIPNGARILVPA